MITVSQLVTARPTLWTSASDGWNAMVNLARQTSADIRDSGQHKVQDNWQDAVGQKAGAKLGNLANEFDIAGYTFSSVVMVLEGLATAVEMAQQTLADALAQAAAIGLAIADDGTVTVVEDGLPGAAADAQAPAVQELVHTALNAATTADQDATKQLHTLLAQTTATNAANVLDNVQSAASQDELDMLAAILPTGATPAEVADWWNSLTPQQQTELENAVPTKLYGLNGIPQSVRQQLAGSGPVNKMTFVQYALDHWNDTSLDWDGEDNCTNFTSIALNHAGMQVVNNSPPDQWSPGFTEFGGWVAAETSTPSWGAAQNLHDFLTTYEGARQVPLSQAKPGDAVFWQDDAGDGATPGHIHHTAIVTAVMPNGDIRYTQHSDSAVDQSLDGRSQQVIDVGGAQHPVVVQLSGGGS
jgi:hypothetical protein